MPIARSTIRDIGYNRFNRRELFADRDEPDNPDLTENISLTQINQVLPSNSITFDKLTIDKLYANEDMQSSDFVTGSSGWLIEGNGDVEFNDGTFRGTLIAGEIHIPDEDTTANSFHTDGDGNSWWGCTETDFNDDNSNAAAYVLKTGEANFSNVTVNGSTLGFTSIYGDGSDGTVTISGNTTLTADMFYDDLTVDSGVTLTTGGYRIYVKGTLTNNGTIARNGNDGGAGGGSALSATTTGGSGAGGAGNNPATAGGASNPGYGGAGGAGGASGGAIPGAAGGSVTNPAIGINAYPFTALMTDLPSTNHIKGGGGGGGGGFVGVSGGGGSGGGVIFIAAKTLTNSATGTIQANGGDGGAGGFANGGGGGGGGGGVVLLVYGTKTDSGTIEASGGTGGTANGTGVNGTDGTDGNVIEITF